MSAVQWHAQRAAREAELREEWEAAQKAGWEREYEEWLASRDEEPNEENT